MSVGERQHPPPSISIRTRSSSLRCLLVLLLLLRLLVISEPRARPAFVRGRGSRSSSVRKPRFQPPTAVLVYDEKIRTGKKDRKSPGISTPLEILTFFKKNKKGDIVLSSSHSVPWVSAPSPPCCEGGQPRHPPLIIVASGSKLPALVKSSATTRGFLAGFQVDLHTH